MDFFKEFGELIYSKPKNALSSRATQNCPYGDYLYRSKNVYLSYFLNDCEDCYYTEYLTKARDCVDCCYVAVGELCYECIDCSGLYNCSFLQDCHNCSDCNYCLDCLNCKNCFGSFGLRQQQFCIFNKPYDEAAYHQKLELLKKNPPAKILQILKPELEKHPRLYARLLKGNENCLGDYIYFSKDCYQSFNVRNLQNSAYVCDMMNAEFASNDCVDCDFASNIELCYECQTSSACNNCNFLDQCSFCSDCEYCVSCHNCQNCFGCIYMMNKQYCILNRQFTRDEYLIAVAKIKEELKKAKTYGKSLADILK